MAVQAERAEAAKLKLSVVKKVEIELPKPRPPLGRDAAAAANVDGGDCDGDDGESILVELTRDRLEQLCEPLLQRLKGPLYEANPSYQHLAQTAHRTRCVALSRDSRETQHAAASTCTQRGRKKNEYFSWHESA